MKLGYNKPLIVKFQSSNPQSNILKNKKYNVFRNGEKLGSSYYFYKFSTFSQD